MCRCASVFCVNDSIFSVCAQAGGGRPSQYSPCLERRLLIPLLPGKCGYKYLQHMEALMTQHTQAHTETPKQTWMHGRICRGAGERVSTRSCGYMLAKQEKTGLRDATSASITNRVAHYVTLFIETALVLKVGDACDTFLCQVKTLNKFALSAMWEKVWNVKNLERFAVLLKTLQLKFSLHEWVHVVLRTCFPW